MFDVVMCCVVLLCCVMLCCHTMHETRHTHMSCGWYMSNLNYCKIIEGVLCLGYSSFLRNGGLYKHIALVKYICSRCHGYEYKTLQDFNTIHKQDIARNESFSFNCLALKDFSQF